MTDKEILQKAIVIAEKNGFELNDNHHLVIDNFTEEIVVQNIIWSHNFAKALWGIEEIPIVLCNDIGYKNKMGRGMWNCENCGDFRDYLIFLPAWQYHLQQMVISENPIKYLEKFL